MRRIAAHRIYLLPQAEWRSAAVIELNEAGEVVRVSPLTEEGAHIEWLSGEIIVSPFPLVRESQENFQAFLFRITKQRRMRTVSRVGLTGYYPLLRNSAHTIAVAIATFNDSLVGLPCG